MLWFLGGFVLGIVVYRHYGEAVEELLDMFRGSK